MLLRRVSARLKTQEWASLLLELLVVVVGIFLAVQVDRWYENERLLSEEGQHLAALAEDFAASREDIEFVISRYQLILDAGETLLAFEKDALIAISNDEFYRLMADVVLRTTIEPKRRAYDALVATGKIDALTDESLKADLGEFYSLIDRESYAQLRRDMDLAFVWPPYVAAHLDMVALVKSAHPENTAALKRIHPPDRYTEIVGTDEFKAAVTVKWHYALDRVNRYRLLLEQAKRVEEALAENRSRLSADNEA